MSTGAEVASLFVRLGANTTEYDTAMRQANDDIQGFGDRLRSSIGSVGRTLTGLGASATAVTAPLSLALVTGVQAASSFDSALAEIGVRAGIAGEDLQGVADYALAMGAATQYSSQQALGAFLDLLTSGSSLEEAYAQLPEVLTLAAAGGMDLANTADIVTNIMASFNLQADQASVVTNALSSAASSSSATVGELGEAYANVGNVAAQFGLSVEDTAAALAVFHDNGIKGGEAGTQLKSMLLNMSRPTSEVQEAWDDLGTSMYDSEGNMRDLGVIIGDLDTALDQLPVEEQNRLMQQLGGSYGIMGLSALRSSITMEEMKERMDSAADASDIAEGRMDTFAGSVDSLRGSVETLQIVGLTPLMNNTLKPLAQLLTRVVNGVTTWLQENPKLTQVLGDMAFAASIVGPAVGAIGLGLVALASPAILAGAALAGVAAGIAGLASAYREGILNEQLTGLFDDLQSGDLDLAAVETWANDNLDAVLGTVVSVAGIVFGGPIGAGIGIASLIGKAIESDFLGIGTFLEESGIKATVETAFSDFKATIDNLINAIFGGGQQGDTPLVALTGGITEAAEQSDASGLTAFVSDIQTAINGIIGIAGLITEDIITGIQDLADGVSGFVTAIMDTDTSGLYNVIRPIIGAIGGIVSFTAVLAGGAIGSTLSFIGSQLEPFGQSLNSLVSAVSAIGNGDFGTAATLLVDSFKQFPLVIIGAGMLIGPATGMIKTAFTSLGTALSNVNTKMLLAGATMWAFGRFDYEEVTQGLNDFGDALNRLGSGDSEAAADAGRAFGETLEGAGIGEAANDVIGAIEALTNTDLPSVAEGFEAWGSAIQNAGIVLSVGLDNIKRGFYLFSLDLQLRVLEFVEGFRNTLLGIGIDIAPTITADRQALDRAMADFNVANVIREQLQRRNASGDVYTLDLAGLIGVDTSGNIIDQAEIDAIAANMGVQGKLILERTIAELTAEGDTESLKIVLPLAEALEIDTTGAQEVINSALGTLDTTAATSADVSSDVNVTPTVANLIELGAGIVTEIETITVDPELTADTTVSPLWTNSIDFANSLRNEIESQTIEATVTANITVDPNVTTPQSTIQQSVTSTVSTTPSGGMAFGGAMPGGTTNIININSKGVMSERNLADTVARARKRRGI